MAKLFGQNKEHKRCLAELVIANKEIYIQHEEKVKREAELIIANKELVFQNREKEKRAAELIIANKELLFQNAEKEKRADELIIINKELLSLSEQRVQRIKGLEEMLFMVSHKVRQPVTQILGLSTLLESAINSPERLKIKVEYIKESAIKLDTFTRELTAYIAQLLPLPPLDIEKI